MECVTQQKSQIGRKEEEKKTRESKETKKSEDKDRYIDKDRDRDRDRDRGRDRRRDRDRDRNSDRDRDRDRDRDSNRNRDKGKDRDKDKDKNRDRDRDRDRNRNRDRDRDKSSHNYKFRVNNQDKDRDRDPKNELDKDATEQRQMEVLNSNRERAASSIESASNHVDMRNIDWFNYLDDLDNVFFRPGDFITAGSPEYEEFVSFLRRYQHYQQSQYRLSQKESQDKATVNTSELTIRQLELKQALGLPSSYHSSYRLKCYINCRPLPPSSALSKALYDEFKNVLCHFEKFRQTRNFKKVKKLQEQKKGLPVAEYQQEIVECVKNNQVTIIAADTGAGKSTQVPQYLMAAGYKNICCTQPRRIACISLSKRVAFETLNVYGSEIAYQIRFDSSKTSKTKILFLTEGLLLRQINADPLLSNYDVVIMDEVHERNIYCDFLLGVIKSLLPLRPTLKVVLMSATINIDLFSSYFKDAPVIQIPGRLYPIETRYIPPENVTEMREGKLDTKPYINLLQEIDNNYPASERGDVLIFMSGTAEIQALVEDIQIYANKNKNWIVLPLYSSLGYEKQEKVFHYPPDNIRKCIVSTNIAETSVTIDGIRFVIDSGKVKEMGYDGQVNMLRLQEFPISQASAEQRKGRAGRTGPGVCYRLYDNNDYSLLSQYSTPEIRRVPIVSMLLQVKTLTGTDPRVFDFIEPPSLDSIELGIESLKNHQALNPKTEEVTVMGKMLSKLPVSVSLGKMLIFASILNVVDPVITIASLLSVKSPFVGKHVSSTSEEYEKRHKFDSTHGDAFTLLNAFNEWIKVKEEKKVRSRLWCKEHGLEEQRFFDVMKLKSQFKDLLVDNNLCKKEESHRGKRDSNKRGRYQREHEQRQHERQQKFELASLKKRYKSSEHKMKILSLSNNDDDDDVDEDDNNDGVGGKKSARGRKGSQRENFHDAINDIEFSLQRQKQGIGEKSVSEKEMFLLQLILGHGLYPNIAVPDPANKVRRSTEFVFHTRLKPLMALHPTCVYYGQPDYIDTSSATIKEILCYMSLLETKKPYIVNCVKARGLQSLLLFSHSFETTPDGTRILIDGWLGLSLPHSDMAMELLMLIIRLRSWWDKVVTNKLKLMDSTKAFVDNKDVNPSASDKETILKDKEKQAKKLGKGIKLNTVLLDFVQKCKTRNDLEEMKNNRHLPILTEDVEDMEKKMTSALTQFMEIEIPYKLVRVKQSEMDEMIRKVEDKKDNDHSTDHDKNNKIDDNGKSEDGRTVPVVNPPEIIGIWISENVRIGSLKEGVAWTDGGHLLSKGNVLASENKASKKSKIQIKWTCTLCKKKHLSRIEELIRHHRLCLDNEVDSNYGSVSGASTLLKDPNTGKEPIVATIEIEDSPKTGIFSKETTATTIVTEMESKSDNLKINRENYLCTICQKDFNFSKIEILKHKKQHST